MTFISYYKEKNNDSKYQKLIEKLKNGRKELENRLLAFTEKKIKTSTYIQDKILPKYNKDLLISSIKSIYNEVNTENSLKKDGIPVIKRVEEKDNVKDIMINNYTANDDIYYNRPPIGKPKVKRMKRNNEKDNNLNNYQEHNKNTKTSQEYKNNEEEVKNNDKLEISNGNENISNNKRRNNKNNITTNAGVFPSQLKSIANEREILLH